MPEPADDLAVTRADPAHGTLRGRETDTAHLLVQMEAARIALRRTFEDVISATAAPDPAPA
jgi:hypothetical protein